jgi:two-component system CheB/CheR fusion protein
MTARKPPPPSTGADASAAETLPQSALPFPVVGIGASAGGLAAFEAFFSGMPLDVEPEMAFVLVQHLAPDHKSMLSEIIQRCTRMQVAEVEDGMIVQKNRVYIIPPNSDMSFSNGRLQLQLPMASRGLRLPIDHFFRSLAHDQRERAIGIVLSGTGSDGSLGVRAIKGEGGMVMAQRPDSTEHNGMLLAAIASCLVDYELLPAEMPARLTAYVNRLYDRSPRAESLESETAEEGLREIFILLRDQSGHDFSQYKGGTILRRIERRMAVHQLKTMDSYVHFLRQTPAEVHALFRDLLIGVTSFFRDAEAFRALEEQVIPALFVGKAPGSVIRVWSTGCSTGEEAYSVAMLLQERLETLRQGFKVQVFATDIDGHATATARAGEYPASSVADLSPERRSRFFTPEQGGAVYRVHKSLRDLLVFSEHDLIKDPPFSKLDLICCRNLLIYMGGELQKKVIPLFHYALASSGWLFLGSSETIGDFTDLFSIRDRKYKQYQRKDSLHSARRLPVTSPVAPAATTGFTPWPLAKRTRQGAPPLRELTEQTLLKLVAPAAVLVNEGGDILYLHGRTGLYLEPSPGEAGVNNILKMAREGLRQKLTTALRDVKATLTAVHERSLRVRTNGDFTKVDVSVYPVQPTGETARSVSLYLVVLRQAEKVDRASPRKASGGVVADKPSATADADESHVMALLIELQSKEEYLQAANEELETSNEELRSASEEMQSVNEELQATNEELETSKEETQSVNEELTTVNAELQTKVAELSLSNNDMNNLLAGTGVGTVFVDHQLRILRVTPAAAEILNLIRGDIGRPIGHVVSNLVGYYRLMADTRAVLASLVPKEIEVQTTAGTWFSMRIRPYRTLENVIQGAVIFFIDVTEQKLARDTLREAEDLRRFAVVVRDSGDAIVLQDLAGRILAWNPTATRLYGWTEAEALTMNIQEVLPEDRRDEELAVVRRLVKTDVLAPYRGQRLAKNGAVVDVWLTATALVDANGKPYAIATTERLGG